MTKRKTETFMCWAVRCDGAHSNLLHADGVPWLFKDKEAALAYPLICPPSDVPVKVKVVIAYPVMRRKA